MAINIDLKAPPAFDKSIVPAYQQNFNRIRDAFLQTSMQVTFLQGYVAGAWPQTINILVPYKCDILLHTEVTAWNTAIGFGGTIMIWDGANLPIFADKFWNIANTHDSTTCINAVRGVLPGTHALTQGFSSGTMTSDANDRLRWSATFFQVA